MPDKVNVEQKYKITVVIPNYNGAAYLRGCLESLIEEKKLSDTPEFEIVVVDNGSTDESTVILGEGIADLRSIYLKENTGFCHAVNVGINSSQSPYIILLNNDTKIKTGFIKALYNAILNRPRAFSVSAKMLMWDNPKLVDDAGDYYCALGWAYGRGKGRDAKKYEKGIKIFSSCGGAAIYKREIFEKIGLFDESHFAYLEDVDIGYRARINGYYNYYEPKAEVIHYGSASTGSRYNERKTALASANNVYIVLKNMPFLQLLINMPFLFTGFFIKFLFFTKKKMGKLYVRGVWNGIRKGLQKEGRKHKVPFKFANLPHYIVIQWELFINIFRIILKIS